MQEIRSVVFSAIDGEYLLSGDDRQIAVIKTGVMFHVGLTRQGLTIDDTLRSYGTFKKVFFKGVSAENSFRIKPAMPSLQAKESDDNLALGISDNSIEIVNIIDLEKYISGCVETEGGPNNLPEYYKAQAVLCRTYAIKNFSRHALEGFNLCDGIHCQAFNGKSRMNPLIYDAVSETRNLILADNDSIPIMTAYHANCGGISSSASMAWNKDLPYLIPVRDPFCDGSSQYAWKKSLTIAEWDNYLESKGMQPGSDSLSGSFRQKYLDPEKRRLPLSTIRDDLKLKSSFFTVQQQNGSVIIQGQGYGHGVGMCQEGAMEMARVGYSYVDILMFYFHHVNLENR